MLTLLLINMSTLAFNIQPGKGEPTTIIVPDDYPTIQEAINAASPGDIIYVDGPNYYRESVIVNKSVSLIGKFGPGLVSFYVVANDVYIKGFYFSSEGWWPYGRCIVLHGVSGCNISNVIVSEVDEGDGIVLTNASNNVIANSWVRGFIEDGCIVFERSSNNTIFGNTIEARCAGSSIYLYDSSDNKFFHNQFSVYEARQVEVIGSSINVWDDGYPSGGNYWSDYTGVDLKSGPNQDQSGSDGIGDTPYVIDTNNRDRYPLTKPYGGPHDIGITNLTTSKTVIGQDYSLNISIKIINYGINTETFNLTMYANTSVIQSLTDIVLASRNSTTITFTWNTTGFAKGNYTISAYAEPVMGEMDTADNTLPDGWIIITIPGDCAGADPMAPPWCDGKVFWQDLLVELVGYGATPADPRWTNYYLARADFNSDNQIFWQDLLTVLVNYGKSDP